jgi:hypothetical protein
MFNDYAELDANAYLATAATASGTNAEVAIAADPLQFWVIDWITWSYGGNPTNGRLEVLINGTVVWQIDITVGGPGHIEFQKPLYRGVKGQAVTVRLNNGGVANKLNVRYR